MFSKQTNRSASDYASNMDTRSEVDNPRDDPQTASRNIIKWMWETGELTEQMNAHDKETTIRKQLENILIQQIEEVLKDSQPAESNEEQDNDTQEAPDEQIDEEQEDKAYPIQVIPTRNGKAIFDNDKIPNIDVCNEVVKLLPPGENLFSKFKL